ncbi:hypothetical protein ABFS83_08G110800 [Erythranthe nasuta]
MVRFSCFQAHILTHHHKNKRTVQQSSEAMQKTFEDKISSLTSENKPCLKKEGDMHSNITDHATDYSHSEHGCRSEEIEGKYSSDGDIIVRKNSQIKKSQSMGSCLNLEGRSSGADGSEDVTEQRFSYNGSVNNSGINVQDGVNSQEPMPSNSVQAGSDFAKNISIFSIGEPQQTEKEDSDKDDTYLSGVVDSGDITPRPVLVKSSSLPRIGSPNGSPTSFLTHAKSADDLNTLDSIKKGTKVGRQAQFEEVDTSLFNNEKNINGEIPADGVDETYNYLGSSKDWIIPVSNGVDTGKGIQEETPFHHWDELPAKDFRLKRIQEWVVNLQHCGPLEESNESAPYYDQELSKVDPLSEETTAPKTEVKVNPGMEAAKRYISSLNASATAAQLTNLGLVVIPFFSAFVSLKALNLSGNDIVRIAAGALPRGLHILNLSKNNISTIEGLRDLTRLRVLDLSYNRILRIGHGLAACSSLKELYLAGNKISEVEGLHRLLKLNVLDLRFNKISTTKCLGQIAANYNCLQAISLEGNPAQKNVGDEQLKKYVQSLLPNLTYYNRQSVKVGSTKDTSDRSARLSIGSHQMDRGHRLEAKSTRKGAHGIVAQKVSSSSNHGRKSQAVMAALPKSNRSRSGGRLPPTGMKTATQGHELTDLSKRVLSLRNDFSFPRSRSEGNLGGL